MKNTILELHEKFCEEALLRNYRPSTIEWWRQSLKMFCEHFKEGEVSRVNDITLFRLESYFLHKRREGWSAHTYSNQYRSLSAFFKWCVQVGHLDVNPLNGIERPRLEKKLPKRISAEDAKLVLNYAFYSSSSSPLQRHRNRAVLATMLYAGLRLAEVLALELRHVDLERRAIFVECGKGAKDRLVPINPTLGIYLAQYLEARQRVGRRTSWFFTHAREDVGLTRPGIKKLVEKVRRGTGVAFSAHRLRHTFATLMLEGGCDLFSLKEMMGHSRIETTLGYLSATLGHLHGQIEKHPLGMARKTKTPERRPGAEWRACLER